VAGQCGHIKAIDTWQDKVVQVGDGTNDVLRIRHPDLT
jgi:soluble P-type ATPase